MRYDKARRPTAAAYTYSGAAEVWAYRQEKQRRRHRLHYSIISTRPADRTRALSSLRACVLGNRPGLVSHARHAAVRRAKIAFLALLLHLLTYYVATRVGCVLCVYRYRCSVGCRVVGSEDPTYGVWTLRRPY
eukprot:scaffold4161_cov101-Isochrysis_galbana.AAC.8